MDAPNMVPMLLKDDIFRWCPTSDGTGGCARAVLDKEFLGDGRSMPTVSLPASDALGAVGAAGLCDSGLPSSGLATGGFAPHSLPCTGGSRSYS